MGIFTPYFTVKGEILGVLGENSSTKMRRRGRDGSGAYLAVDLVEVYVRKGRVGN